MAMKLGSSSLDEKSLKDNSNWSVDNQMLINKLPLPDVKVGV
jgi:hypothetical protein